MGEGRKQRRAPCSPPYFSRHGQLCIKSRFQSQACTLSNYEPAPRIHPSFSAASAASSLAASERDQERR